MADPKVPVTATVEETAAFRKEQEAEWGTWVAVAPIAFNGAMAYNPGDPVPASNVEKYGYDKDGSVAKVGNKAAQEVIAAIHNAGQAGLPVLDPVSLNVPVNS